jgi:hypothetical protein
MATTLLRALALAAAAAAAGGGSAGPVTHSWATPVFVDFLAPQSSAALRPRLAALAQDLQAQQPAGVQKSNVGGWQSAPLAFSPDEDPALAQLVEHILDAARWFVSDGLGDDMRRQRALITGEYRLEVASLWINVNRARDYNNAHVHTDSFLSGVYYVDAGPRPLSAGGDEDDGGSVLVLSDPRVQLQQFEYACRKSLSIYRICLSRASLWCRVLLWHPGTQEALLRLTGQLDVSDTLALALLQVFRLVRHGCAASHRAVGREARALPVVVSAPRGTSTLVAGASAGRYRTWVCKLTRGRFGSEDQCELQLGVKTQRPPALMDTTARVGYYGTIVNTMVVW